MGAMGIVGIDLEGQFALAMLKLEGLQLGSITAWPTPFGSGKDAIRG